MKGNHIVLIIAAIFLTIFGALTVFTTNLYSEHNEYCRERGYDNFIPKEMNDYLREFEGVNYIQCEKEEIIDKKLVKTIEWIEYK